MKNVKLLMLAVMVVFVGIGCKKDATENFEQSTISVNPSKVFKIPSTPEEKLLVKNLQSITDVFKVLYQEKSNLKLVNAAIFSKAYTDESVLLKDLIYPENSWLSQNSKFKGLSQKWNVSLTQFATNFWNEVNKQNSNDLIMFLNNLKPKSSLLAVNSENTVNSYDENGGNVEEVSIYFPYSEEFLPVEGGGTYEPITSIITATADADEGVGSLPYYENGIFQYYVPVLINDDYAENNPTHIIGLNGIESHVEPLTPLEAFPPENPIDVPNLPREVKQVYVGDVKIHRHQYDALISFTNNGGGSEIVFTRSDGFLKVVDGQVQADNYFTPVKTIGRRDIRKENWIDFSYEWDGDWETTNLQQNLAIYEEDNRNSSEFSGQISTTVKLSDLVTLSVGPIGFKITFKSDDALIRQLNYNRDVFFILNRTNLEGEMRNGWPVRDKNGPVSYTLNDRTYF